LLWLLPASRDRLAGHLALVGAIATAVGLTAALVQSPAGIALVPVATVGWVSEIGLSAIWLKDGLVAMFALLTAWVGLLVTLFALHYMPHANHEMGSTRPLKEFYALLSAFTGAMLGLVSAGTLLQFYLFWELTSLASFLLIGFWNHREDARDGAFRSIMLTTVGSLAMLVGLLALGSFTGVWTFPELVATRAAWQGEGWLVPVTALILVGALSKSAQFPFPSWLPAAMAAPTPVSAFLHSSTLVAAGVFLLSRFFPLLSDVPSWGWVLLGSAAATIIPAGLMALRQAEIKALLAYSTVSQYGFFFLAFGLSSVEGAQSALYAFFVHALIKAGLFLVAGSVSHLTNEKRFEGLGGLAKTNPMLTLLAICVALSLGGVPIFGGFYYKEELLHAAYEHQAWLLLAGLLVGGMLTFLYMLRFLQEVFLGQPHPERPVQRLPWTMGLSVAALAGAALLTGIYPNWPNAAILDPAIASVVQAPANFRVELKFGGVLLMSLAVLAFGLVLWAVWRWQRMPREWLLALPGRFALGGAQLSRWYDRASEAVLALHGGNLRRYLRYELAAVLVLLAVSWVAFPWPGVALRGQFDLALTLMLGLAVLSSMATIWLRRHVLAVLALSISGYAIGGVFTLMHAPDVALAQVLVETLASFSIVIALRQSQLVHPERTKILSAGRRDWGRWAIALGVGGAVGWLTFWVGRDLPGRSIGAWYARETAPRTGMFDIVTAILTDFRALDTAIEILVFASAAFAVIGLFFHRERRHE
jgi:multicomponent K+:H+ antiporter subunit A